MSFRILVLLSLLSAGAVHAEETSRLEVHPTAWSQLAIPDQVDRDLAAKIAAQITANPKNAEALVSALVAANPEHAEAIVRAAIVTLAPDRAAAIAVAAITAAPARAQAITDAAVSAASAGSVASITTAVQKIAPSVTVPGFMPRTIVIPIVPNIIVSPSS